MIGKWALQDIRRKASRLLRHRGRSWTDSYLAAQRAHGTWAFIHINKCGGTSVEQALNIPKIHDTARQRRDLLGADRWAALTSFSIVRHPHDRVMSLYRYRVKTNQTGMGDGHIGLDDWVRAVFAERDPAYLDQPLMFQPARAWLVDEQDSIIVDVVGKLETIDADWPRIQALTGIHAPLPRANATAAAAAQPARAALRPASRDILAAHFEADFTTFGYEP